MHIKEYIKALKNEGFGLVEDLRVIHEGKSATTVEVTNDIAINLLHSRDKIVDGAKIYSSLLPDDDLHYTDTISVIDIVTRLTTSLTIEDRKNIYKRMTNRSNSLFSVTDAIIKTETDEERVLFTFAVEKV